MHFVEDTFHITAPFASAGIRHDAIMTEVVAASHDGDITGDMVSADAGRNHIPIGFCRRKFHINSFLSSFNGTDQFRKCQVSIRSGNQIYVVMFDQVILYTFSHTSQHTYDQVLAFLAQRMEKLQPVQDLLLCVVADGTGVHKYSICFFQRFAGRIAGHLHDGSDDFTVGYVHLTAVSFDE